jgi:hypothetical protein
MNQQSISAPTKMVKLWNQLPKVQLRSEMVSGKGTTDQKDKPDRKDRPQSREMNQTRIYIHIAELIRPDVTDCTNLPIIWAKQRWETRTKGWEGSKVVWEMIQPTFKTPKSTANFQNEFFLLNLVKRNWKDQRGHMRPAKNIRTIGLLGYIAYFPACRKRKWYQL